VADERIPITKPFFGEEELRAVQLPLESGWVVQGPYVDSFETKFAAYTGAAHAVATSSCTTALQTAVAALDLGPGDEVIVPAFTWISTANVVEALGARPVFCDVDLATFNIDPGAIEPLITERTVGLLPVHLFGLPAAIEEVVALARTRGLWVLEDCACSFGGWYRGKHTGTFGELGCFSFHPRKSITTGEGGMITTARDDLASLARSVRDHGASRSDLQRHSEEGGFLLSDYEHLGFNYRMTDIQAAIGREQLKRLPAIVSRRRALAQRYTERFQSIHRVTSPHEPQWARTNWQSYAIRLDGGIDQCALMQKLLDAGIATRRGVMNVHREPSYPPGSWRARPLTRHWRWAAGSMRKASL